MLPRLSSGMGRGYPLPIPHLTRSFLRLDSNAFGAQHSAALVLRCLEGQLSGGHCPFPKYFPLEPPLLILWPYFHVTAHVQKLLFLIYLLNF